MLKYIKGLNISIFMPKNIPITDDDVKYVLQKYNIFLEKNEINNNILNTFNSAKVEIEEDNNYDNNYNLCVNCKVIFSNNSNDELIMYYCFTPNDWCQISHNACINEEEIFYFGTDSSYNHGYHSNIYKKYNIPLYCKDDNNKYRTLIDALSMDVRPIYVKHLENDF